MLGPAEWQESKMEVKEVKQVEPGLAGRQKQRCLEAEPQVRRLSPAAGIVGALGGAADGAERPLGATDRHVPGIPDGQKDGEGEGEIKKGTEINSGYI